MQISDSVHVGKIQGNKDYLYLIKEGEDFVWQGTDLKATTIEGAIKLARKAFALNSFELLKCGFLYTLPERDEHGMNATFQEMALSYSSMNGTFFHPELGHNCLVQGASEEALSLWRRLKK